MEDCPTCGATARAVPRVTLEHLLRPERLDALRDETHFVCAARGCPTVYFSRTGRVFEERDLRVAFGLKGSATPQTVCYCFDHTVEEIRDEIARTATSTVIDRIKTAMGESGCRCETMNPLGRCCLPSVHAVVESQRRPADPAAETETETDAVGEIKTDTADAGAAAESAHHGRDCCPPALPVPKGSAVSHAGSRRSAPVALAGSLIAAALSSACCWLPLLLIAGGASAVGVAGFFERWRIPFILVAVLLLGFGFHVTYRASPSCRDGACPASSAPGRRIQRITLWVASCFVGAMILFPGFVGAVTATGSLDAPARAESTDTAPLALAVDGMTCAGCAGTLRKALSQVPGVSAVEVDYQKGTAVMRFDAGEPAPVDRVLQVVRTAGYRATVSDATLRDAARPAR